MMANISKFQLHNSTVHDETGVVAKLVFRELDFQTAKPSFEILIDNKQIVFPATLPPYSSRIQFLDKHAFTFIPTEPDFIKITAKKEQTETVYYVNTKKCIKKTAYVAYKYMPKPITLEEAKLKLENVSKLPGFQPQVVAFNSHGVALFGREENRDALYWANPHEDHCKKMEIGPPRRLPRDKSCVTSADGALVLEHTWRDGFSLNSEPAESIALDQLSPESSAPTSA